MKTFDAFDTLVNNAFPVDWEAGLLWVRRVQTLASPALTAAMRIITNLVSEYVFLLVITGLYWFWNKKESFRLGLLVIVSHWCNEAAKYAFGTPRPFHLDPSVGMIAEKGYGFPSGHAQLSLTLIIPLAWLLTESASGGGSGPAGGRQAIRPAIRIAAGALCLLVAFSRIYLGVHFPWDIAGGWFLGALLLILFFSGRLPAARKKAADLAGFFVRRGEKAAVRAALSAAALGSFAMVSLLPHNLVPGALFLGFCAGYVWNRFPAAFTKAGTFTQSGEPAGAFPSFSDRGKAAAVFFTLGFFLAGLAGAAAIYAILKGVFPGPESSYYGLFRFIRYALLAFWVSGGAPRLAFLFRRRVQPEGGTGRES